MKIAILYIALGKYDRFFKRFFKSCDRYFVPGAEKEYFVFTDSADPIFTRARVHRFPHQNMGWPDNTLQRFRLFSGIAPQLAGFDYAFFFNANMVFEKPIGQQALPAAGLVFTLHPGYYDKDLSEYPYERDPHSLACVGPGEGSVYICGGVNGGETGAYLAMYAELRRRVDADTANGITAVHNDESHLNRYLMDLPEGAYTLWGPQYVYPELYFLPGVPMTVRLLEKDRFFGVAGTRGAKRGPLGTLAHLAYVWGSWFANGLRRRVGR